MGRRGNERVTAAPLWAPFIASHLAYQEAAGRPASTRYQRSYHLRRFSRAHLDPHAVTMDDLVTWLGNSDWGDSYRRSVRSALRGFYRWLHVTGRHTLDPAALLPPVATSIGLPRPLEETVIQRAMLEADQRTRMMLLLGGHAGLRCCEIAAVHSRDIVGARGSYSLLVHGKGRRERLVPLGDLLARDILTADGYLFPGQIGGHLSAAYVSKLLSRALPTGMTAHQLRHRFATQALRGSGGNLRVVQELLGHSSIATTQVYTAVETDELRTAANYAASIRDAA